jgi:putative ABC transport system permease protein
VSGGRHVSAGSHTSAGSHVNAGRHVSAGRRPLRRVVLGEAGPAPALVLAGVAVVVAFIVVAGSRELVSADNRATGRALAAAPTQDTGALVAADLQAGQGRGVLGAQAIGALGRAFAARLPLPRLFPAAARWGGVSVPPLQMPRPAGPDGKPEQIELGFRPGLAGHSQVIAGSLPSGPAVISPGAGAKTSTITFNIAATRVTARTFGLRIGAVHDLGRVSPSGPLIRLRLTGIVRQAGPGGGSSSFWQLDPLLSRPSLMGPAESPHWLGGVFIGRDELAAMGTAYAGISERATWFFPLATSPAAPTAADIPRLEAGIAALASSPAIRAAEVRAGAGQLRDNAVTTGLANGLAVFESQWQSTAGADSVVVVGLFVAGLMLLLICSGLAAQAYRSELVQLRVRGGSLAQVARRMLARSACVQAPALVAGFLAAVAVLPGAGSTAGLVLGGLTILAAIAGLPLICVLEHRRVRSAGADRPSEEVARRTPARRLVAELAVVLVAAAALADVRLRGATPGAGRAGTTGLYLSASAVLVAAAIAILVNRAYRGPLRVLARAAAARRGAVGAVGLARAAVSRADSVLPALAVMLGLTLTVFGAMVLASISTGQVAGSWSRVGADATVTAGGTSLVTAADLRAFERVPGVTHATAVYAGHAGGQFAAVLTDGAASRSVGIAVVDPASYAALSAATPWPRFPDGLLARPAAPAGAPIPVLVTPGIAAQVAQARAAAGAHGRLRLQDNGQSAPITIAGTITRTAVMPAGGQYLVVSRSSVIALTAIPSPDTALITGRAINVRALRAIAARVLPGNHLVLRSQVLHALTLAPALHLSERLYLVGAAAAAALSALAVLFAVAASARPRAAMLSRLAALGMARSQAVLVGVTEAVPLLAVAAAGTASSVWLLAEFVGPVLGLNTFTGSAQPLALRPTWVQLIVPLAGAALLAVALLAIDGVMSGRAGLAAALRQEEVR